MSEEELPPGEIIVPPPAPEISEAVYPVAPSLLETEHEQGLDEEVLEEPS